MAARPTGVLLREEWWDGAGKSRLDGPAVTCRDSAGRVLLEEWWLDGQKHRNGDDAAVTAYADGVIVLLEWWQGGELLYRHSDLVEDIIVESRIPTFGTSSKVDRWKEHLADKSAVVKNVSKKAAKRAAWNAKRDEQRAGLGLDQILQTEPNAEIKKLAGNDTVLAALCKIYAGLAIGHGRDSSYDRRLHDGFGWVGVTVIGQQVVFKRSVSADNQSPDGDPSVFEYTSGGQLCSVEWWYQGKIHRGGGKPAIVSYTEGSADRLEWWTHGRRSKTVKESSGQTETIQWNGESMYSCMIRYETGSIRDVTTYYDGTTRKVATKYSDGRHKTERYEGEHLHSDFGPAVLYCTKSDHVVVAQWYHFGRLHRLHGFPAVMVWDRPAAMTCLQDGIPTADHFQSWEYGRAPTHNGKWPTFYSRIDLTGMPSDEFFWSEKAPLAEPLVEYTINGVVMTKAEMLEACRDMDSKPRQY
jgi:hypothetical protein